MCKSQSGQSDINKLTTSGLPTGDKGEVDSSSRERLVYLTTCLIGHQVEVQVIDGSVFSGIFHATNAENDFGLILKMACMTKAGSSQEQKNISDSVNKTPSKTLIISSKDLVQTVAKQSVPINEDIWDSKNIEIVENVSDSAMNNSLTDSENRRAKITLDMNFATVYIKKESSEKGLSADATAYAPSNVPYQGQETMSCSEVSKGEKTVKIHESTTQPASSSGLSSSSSMGSLNSEKSTLNPNAKVRIKWEPHLPHTIYGPQTTSYQSQQPYFQQNVPQYGQQMPHGQPRQMVYMPTYPPVRKSIFSRIQRKL
ncbi:hypothetical protein L1987_45324 [Smallanthus sonchifolius]|uniref:Uncharacterized protein n=1 Tax=Smallanthus sonchifolius TaxID=185202 RepID=A0ACB9GSY5_9ASTR|nr:hypothetical protein L1987_45324 [Smallanthus sonchifolius]